MTSDGFSCAYDRYGIFSKEEIINLANTEGIDYIYKKLENLKNQMIMELNILDLKYMMIHHVYI